MINYLLIYNSMTRAQTAARRIERVGIAAVIQRAPRELSSMGCTYAVRISERDLTKALETLKRASISPSKVFSVYNDGHVSRLPV